MFNLNKMKKKLHIISFFLSFFILGCTNNLNLTQKNNSIKENLKNFKRFSPHFYIYKKRKIYYVKNRLLLEPLYKYKNYYIYDLKYIDFILNINNPNLKIDFIKNIVINVKNDKYFYPLFIANNRYYSYDSKIKNTFIINNKNKIKLFIKTKHLALITLKPNIINYVYISYIPNDLIMDIINDTSLYYFLKKKK